MIQDILAGLVLVMQVAIVLFLVYWLVKLVQGNQFKIAWLAKNRNLAAGIIALVATMGSLFYSEVLGYVPCELCWYQRILMYPLVFLFAVALIRKQDVLYLILPLLIIGSGFSIYHYSTQFFGTEGFCTIGNTENCAVKVEFHYGFMTIPLMALTAFIAIFLVQIQGRGEETQVRKKKKRR